MQKADQLTAHPEVGHASMYVRWVLPARHLLRGALS